MKAGVISAGSAAPAALRPDRPARLPAAARLVGAGKTALPPLLFGLRLWASVCLAFYIAFWLELDNAYWAPLSAALVCQPHLGASLRKGWFRMIGTLVGAVAIVVLTAWFPQARGPFLIGLALWAAGCTLTATLLRNFPSYAAVLAGITALIIASDQLGATGGPSGQAFMLAVSRATEICIGIVCAGLVLGATDFGLAQRRLAAGFAGLAAEIMGGFAQTLASAGAGFAEIQELRRDLLRRVIALEPAIEEAIGESSQLRYDSPVLKSASAGLCAALAGWRSVSVMLLLRQGDDLVRQEAQAVLARMPEELRPEPGRAAPARWLGEPGALGRRCDTAVRELIAMPAATPSARLLADQAAATAAGISRTLDGIALLVVDPVRHTRHHHGARHLSIPDWLPALVNAGRTLVMILALQLFWIVTQWPSGALAVTFAGIAVSLFAPQADQAYGNAMAFMVGACVAAVAAAVVGFAVLPRLDTFAAFCLAIGLVMVPGGAGIAQPWRQPAFIAVIVGFVPLLAPANQMTYNTLQFYNSALAIVGGLSVAALSFRLLPPLSPAFRTRRLLGLTLRDLRRLMRDPAGRAARAWMARGVARLAVLPEAATPLQRSQLLTGLLVGNAIVELYPGACRSGLGAELGAALAALAGGDVVHAAASLAALDDALAASAVPATLHARARLLAICNALTQHAAYFAMEATA